MKLIREARMGPPKTYKTGAVLGSYPKPLLHFSFNQGGVSVIPSKATLEGLSDDWIKSDTTYEEVTHVKPGHLELVAPSKITSISYYDGIPQELTLDVRPTPATMPFMNFVTDYNKLAGKAELPWKTVVLDELYGFSTVLLNWMAGYNPGLLAKAWDWVPAIVTKVTQTCVSMTSLPCHVVVILHSYLDKNEVTGEISEKPNLFGKEFRDEFFGFFSQCFYSVMSNDGKPSLLVSNRYPVKGIGPRWPIGLPKEIKPDFASIYGKELV